MRDLRVLEIYRDIKGGLAVYGWAGDETCGMFAVPSPTDPRVTLKVIASNGEGWDHASVSTERRTPNWTEMEHVKRLFFRDDETAMQLHVPPSEHLSFHPHCLHLWRPNDGREIPRPPSIMVAPTEESAA